MIFKSKPNKIIHKRVRENGKSKLVEWYKFDKNGYLEVDINDLTVEELSNFYNKFEVVNHRNKVKKVVNETFFGKLKLLYKGE